MIFVSTYNPENINNAPAGNISMSVDFVTPGHSNLPVEIEAGTYTATTENGRGYYYVYTATEACTATVTMNDETGWHYSIEVEPASENDEEWISYWHWFDDDPVVSSESVALTAGDALEIYVNTYDPEVWEVSGEVNWTLEVLPYITSTDSADT